MALVAALAAGGIDEAKDILEIDRLAQEAEEELMLRIKTEIYSERNIDAFSRTADFDERRKTQCARATT